MKHPYLVLAFLIFCCGHVYSQKVEILKKSDTFQRKKKSREVVYWSNPADTSGLEYVATISSRTVAMESKALSRLWALAVSRGMKSGANTFMFHSYTDTDSTKPELTLDFFFADDSALQRNTDREEKNVVYIFGNKGKAIPLNINGEEVKIPADSFLRYEVPFGTELKLSKGGTFGGSTGSIRAEVGKPALYYAVSGFGLGGMVPPPGSVGLSFNTGRITPMDPHFARMLMDIQKQRK
ncbi:hypothetical protein [Chitinophaga eiseniae]|uniref:Uncharacterized protein n=1 Tax=Chitinophaga eiseniae TaxID=634771 RepID=A0A847SY92_9BACT|nr:hypothetical protein [Chitinophaga eiseniae]NLR82912.1 hypothetical protein [Chitinophaga eiseniae]